MPDLHRISKRFQKGVANLEDVVRVYQCIRQLPGLIATLEAGGEGDAEVGALIEDVWLSKIRVCAPIAHPRLTHAGPQREAAAAARDGRDDD